MPLAPGRHLIEVRIRSTSVFLLHVGRPSARPVWANERFIGVGCASSTCTRPPQRFVGLPIPSSRPKSAQVVERQVEWWRIGARIGSRGQRNSPSQIHRVTITDARTSVRPAGRPNGHRTGKNEKLSSVATGPIGLQMAFSDAGAGLFSPAKWRPIARLLPPSLAVSVARHWPRPIARQGGATCPWHAQPRRCAGSPRRAYCAPRPGWPPAWAGGAAEQVGNQRKHQEDQRADERGQPDQRMEQEADGEVERYPRQVERRSRAEPPEIASHLIEVAQRLQAIAAGPRLERHPHDHVINSSAQRLVERGAVRTRARPRRTSKIAWKR